MSPRTGRTRLRLGAFANDRLVGWSYSRAEGQQLHMVHSGVDPAHRRRGIYAGLIDETLRYAESRGFASVVPRHVPDSNEVIIPKLRAGFLIAGFEYSEVYGPLVRLSRLCGEPRRALYRARSTPIVPAGEAA